MTADEIRSMQDSSWYQDADKAQSLSPDATPYMARDCFWILREIAAQLADLNERLDKQIMVDIAR